LPRESTRSSQAKAPLDLRLAEEFGVNVIYGGHYATETFGVKALAKHLSKRFRLPWTFLNHPTGL
jgi:putative NIF3 family GTP cyclohydrolase 1 type 2